MHDIEDKRKEFDIFLSSKNFNLSDSEVIKKARDIEAELSKKGLTH